MSVLGSKDYDAKEEMLREYAFEELVRWLKGDHRPSSMAELTYDRIRKIFVEICGEFPTVEKVSDRCNLPVSRARVMISTFKYEQNLEFRKLAWKMLSQSLQNAKPTVELKDVMVVRLDQAEREVLSTLVTELSRGEEEFAPPEPTGTWYGERRVYRLTKDTQRLLLNAIKQKLKEV
jgi:hypothetical protein